MGKYFTVTIKPTIPASRQTAAFGDGDVLFDWTAFNVPKGACKLISATAILRGTNAAAQTGAMEFIFARSENNEAPATIGTPNDTAGGTKFCRKLLGNIFTDELPAGQSGLDIFTIQRFVDGVSPTEKAYIPNSGLILEGEPDSGISAGYDKLYIAGCTADGDLDFSTNVTTTGALDISAASNARISSLDDGSGGSANANKIFEPGDIIHAQDDIIIGEVESTPDASTIIFRTDGNAQYHANGEVLYTAPDGVQNWKIQNGADAAGDLADGDEFYNINPITIILGFER
mgnify:CR=1 FL=1|tara:strand:+ start:24 stop:887 length:864 start_codon:yes stop_codon:yes gene_type:complete